jgi:hypothetical protein
MNGSFKLLRSLFILGLAVLASSSTWAGDYLPVSDASRILFAIGPGNAVYLRNLNELDSTWLGCCQSYYIDTSTDIGKAQFSDFLSAVMSHAPISFYLASKTAGGAFIQVGKF